MSEEEVKKDEKAADSNESEGLLAPGEEASGGPDASDLPDGVLAPAPAAGLQLGSKRFVYATYFAGAIAVAFLGAKIANLTWHRLGTWKSQFGEPRDEVIMPIAAVGGAAAAFYYWKKQSSRIYVEEVSDELSKVTWPSKKEVTNSTAVVIVTTIVATVFFALMDQFWRYVTNLVYGF